MTLSARIHLLIVLIVTVALLSIAVAATVPVYAQKLGPDGAPNPTASVVDEQTLLKQAPRVEGRIDIPDTKAGVLIQPEGRTWAYFHEVLLHRGGAIVILGTIALLALAYFILGKIQIAEGRSGTRILRFESFERFSHWLTAVSFVILGMTGLNITFGKRLLLPLIGPDAFASVSQAAKYAHNFVSFSFVAGLVLIMVIFFRDNLFEKVDLEWIKQRGGFIKNKHAPAGRFNFGEKLVYWLSVAGGTAVSLSGFLLLFPFYGTDIAGMQLAHVVHAVVSVLFVALILAHIYIGTLGMEGAFEAMGTGEVDLNWAKEHHDLWLAKQLANEDRRGLPSATAEE
ncbi:formate dehydrogenase subunit gamma [Bradyrhizobium elkanii]|uniref:formate dehydrogenase subunit gamma n=1 Tax=Bradyrhizobium TaxID=374 RepID=UPI0021673FF8|nr:MULTISPECIES: formate dehydrogenase subunit gamma [Bradyrhizobium]MCS3928899.1 formate dehydrogenase subunit gamma [Bradyrhizobium elkanii]MCS3969454.1 formate dehydrogenase subunit gamma [Bradyrhizobium japonicum]